MIRRSRLVLVMFAMLGGYLGFYRTVPAKAATFCIDYTQNLPGDWNFTTASGFAGGIDPRSPSYKVAVSASTTVGSQTVERVQASLTFPSAVKMVSADFYWLVSFYPASLVVPSTELKLSAATLYSSSVVDAPGVDRLGQLRTGQEHFTYSTGGIDELLLTADLYYSNDGFLHQVFVEINNICFDQIATPTPVFTSTPTRTATPANTNTPTNTPVNTNTPTLTPTGTFFTETPAPTSSPIVPTVGAGFITMPAPRDCGGSLNPCNDDLPFPVPGFPVLGIESPTALAISFAGTATIGAPATGSGNAEQVNNFATRMFEIKGQIEVMGTPVAMLNAQGTPISMAQGFYELGGQIGEGMGFVRALQNLNLGRMGTLIAFILLMFGLMVMLKIFLAIFAILKRWIGFALDVLNTLKPL